MMNQSRKMIKGCGWIKEAKFGCAHRRLERTFTDLRSLCSQLLKEGILNGAIENFARFDPAAKLVALSAALALYDAGMPYSREKKQDIGLLGTSPDGALAANLAYFTDYAQAGRKLGRGNLFIYTLPSSPLAEAAIHFGLQGPLVYVRNKTRPEEELLAQAESLVSGREAPGMLAVIFNTKEANCFFIS
ncbi:MAG: hypothetical protein WC552_01330 [Candidatus Omnitrophota bacterium]